MIALLIAVIYLAFISLGLPDSLLGSAWPVMQMDFNVKMSYMGIITMIISFSTIISTLFSDKLLQKMSTWLLTALSILLTIVALIGFSLSNNFALICLFAIPYGLGAGAIDASLNNYVALNFSSKTMSWLHCFWGVGTIISPYIMSYCLTNQYGWHKGYSFVAILQSIIFMIVLLSFPLWKKNKCNNQVDEVKPANLTLKQKFKIKGVIFILVAFFCYCSFESILIQWTATYFVNVKNITPEKAASFGSLFFIGITIGRFLSGFIASKIGDKKMIRLGCIIIAISIILLLIPINDYIVSLIGFITIGIGCGPIYPSIIHSTPFYFAKKNSQGIIGLQMTCAYIGSTFMPPIFGVIANNVTMKIMPYFILFFFILFLIFIEILNNTFKNKVEAI